MSVKEVLQGADRNLIKSFNWVYGVDIYFKDEIRAFGGGEMAIEDADRLLLFRRDPQRGKTREVVVQDVMRGTLKTYREIIREDQVADTLWIYLK